MEDKNQGKISRRDFLKRAAIAVGGLALKSKDTPNQLQSTLPQQEVEQSKKLTRKEILNNPLGIIDQLIDGVHTIPEEKRTPDQHALLYFFSVKKEDHENSSDGVDIALNYRKSLGAGYALIGNKVDELFTRLEKINIFVDEADLDNTFQFFVNLWRPLEHISDSLNASAKLKDGDPGKYQVQGSNIGQLFSAALWFRPINQNQNYDDQKKEYVAEGNVRIGREDLEDQVIGEWDDIIKMQRWGKVDEAEPRTREELRGFLGIISKFKEVFPLGLMDFKLLSFLTGENKRGHFIGNNEQEKVEVLGDELFKGFQAMKQDKTPIDAQTYFNWFLSGLTHEISHGEDPYNDNSYRFNKYHPQDFMDYFSEYVDMYEYFYYFIDNANANDIELWFIDPISPKGFGVDQLVTEGDVRSFSYECDMVAGICREIQKSTKLQAEVRKRGLDKFFLPGKGKGKEDFLNWQTLLNPDFIGINQYVGDAANQQIKKNISSFDTVTPNHLEELKNFAGFSIESDTAFFAKSAILKMKSMYLFAAHELTRHLALSKDPELNKILSEQYRFLEGTINWLPAHVLTGPRGQYLGYPYDIRISGVEYLQNSEKFGDPIRENQQQILEKLIPGFKYSENCSNFINILTFSQMKTAEKRAKLWGTQVSSEDDPYLVFTKSVFKDILEFNDMYGISTG